MKTRPVVLLLSVLLLTLSPIYAQSAGSVVGSVKDVTQGVLQGARIEIHPGGQVVMSDSRGVFQVFSVEPGRYTVAVSYIGFDPLTKDVDVAAGQTTNVDAVLKVQGTNEQVTVSAGREFGELEAINRERVADNILQVLPADVITSLPNTNIADAIGRMPSVSLERDEGEGKYIQIRGTEPRLSNVTVNGIHLPSPEGVRNVKLDAIPADLVDSVEISKTLSANQDAGAIGGSVNLVTKQPTDQPYLTLLGMGGYTPITGGRNLYQIDGTYGQRFGVSKKFGTLFGFSYDRNNRGIDDLEPGQAVNTLSNNAIFNGPNTEDLRNYHYNRSRYGLDGELDYKLGEMSSVYLRGLFSHFNDYGEDWIYSPAIGTFITSANVNDPTANTCGITGTSGVQGCGNMSFTDVYRTPAQQLLSVQAGAHHVFGGTILTYEAALSQANYTGGFSHLGFNGPGASDNSVAFGVDTSHPFVPKFPVLNGVNIFDPAQYFLSPGNTENDAIFERDAVGAISLSKQYSLGGHFSTFEAGFKGWDARKSSLIDRENFNSAGGQPMTQFLTSFRDNNYYFGNYAYGPVVGRDAIVATIGPAGTTPNLKYNLPNDFDITERIWAGYLMNTISVGRFRFQAGLRVESTADELRANKVVINPEGGMTVTPEPAHNSYVNAFPSVNAEYRIGSETVLRGSYSMGIARPNFGDIAPYITFDQSASGPPYSLGNPDLKPTHAQNFDVLVEHYLKPVGIIQGGFFYKYLTDPIFNSTIPYQGTLANTLINGPNAHIWGFEASWQQQLRFLPGVLKSMGVRANYGYTSSQATFPANFGRVDHPTLARTAPNNWNFDVTYDRWGISARMGLTHNDAYIWSYGGSNAKDPSGDNYLYPHTQVDAQFSYKIPHSHGIQAVVSMLNLNNEVFGFYYGAERYPIQREYYGRTVSAGLRWTLEREKK